MVKIMAIPDSIGLFGCFTKETTTLGIAQQAQLTFDIEDSNALAESSMLTPSQRRGGCAVKKEVAKQPCSAQTGWSGRRQCKLRRPDHPVRSFKGGFAIFLLMSR